MKKHISRGVLLTLLLLSAVLLFCACAEKEVQMQMGEATEVTERAEFTPKNVLVGPQVYAPLTQTYSMGWEAEKGKTFVVVEAQVKNLTGADAPIAQLCRFQLEAGEETFAGQMTAAVSENGTKLTASPTIKAGKSSTVYFVTELSSEKVGAEMTAAFDFSDSDKPAYPYRLTVDTAKPVAVCKTLQLKEAITVDGFAKLTPQKVSFTQKLEPTNPGYFYNYFEAKEKGERLLALHVKVKNLSGKKQDADRFYGIRVVTEDGANYIGSVVSDDEKKANITSYEEIEKDGVRKTYGMVSIPKTAVKDTCTMYLYADGIYYLYEYKKS